MGKNKQQVPRLRFPGFNDAWEQRKFKELVFLRSETVESQDYSVDIELENLESNTGRIIGNTSVRTMSNTLFKKGDILFGKLRPYLNKWRFADEEGVKSGEIWAFSCREGYSNRFIYCVIQSNGFLDEVNITSGTKMPRADWKTVSNIKITIPTIEEQTTIGNFFRQLDAAIASHQRKLERTNKLKKSLLQKMFPKDGEAFPELRFPDFTDAWEQRKLGECGNTFTGLSGKSKFDFGHGSARYITYVNVLNNPIADKNIVGLVEIDDKQNQVKYGDCFFTTSSETPEEVGMSSVWLENTSNFYLNSFCFGYRPTTSFNPYYLAFMLRSDGFRKKVTFLAQGISRFNISKTKVMDLEIFIPSLKEQTTIGNFFRQLDAAIASHQRKP